MPSSHTFLFESQWNSYQWSLNKNVFFHQEIFREAGLLLHSVFKQNPVDIVDLGCGNGEPIIQLLPHLELNHYTGIDLANNVLQQAEVVMNSFGINHEFICGDLFDGLPAVKSVDLIFSAFAIHHGRRQQKQTLFKTLFQQMNTDGHLCLIDIIRYPQQSREDWLVRLKDYLTRQIESPEIRKQTFEHAYQYDYPEYAQDLVDFGIQAGWKLCRQIDFAADECFPVSICLFRK